MRRREFIAGLGGAVVTPSVWARMAHAQQAALPVIGFLAGVSPDRFAARLVSTKA